MNPIHGTTLLLYSQPSVPVLEKEVGQVANTTLSKRDEVNILD